MSGTPPQGVRLTALLLDSGMYISDDGGTGIAFYSSGGVKQLAISSIGRLSIYGPSGATAGIGVPAIYSVGAQTLNTNVAPTTLSFTPPATAGVYRLSAYLDLLTAGTMTFKVKITYKDPGGNARTDIPAFYLQNTTAIIAGGNSANTAGQHIMIPYTFAIDNSATAITIQDNGGTYTAGTYFWTPVLEQLA